MSPQSLALSVDVGRSLFASWSQLKKQQQTAIEGILCGRDDYFLFLLDLGSL